MPEGHPGGRSEDLTVDVQLEAFWTSVSVRLADVARLLGPGCEEGLLAPRF